MKFENDPRQVAIPEIKGNYTGETRSMVKYYYSFKLESGVMDRENLYQKRRGVH